MSKHTYCVVWSSFLFTRSISLTIPALEVFQQQMFTLTETSPSIIRKYSYSSISSAVNSSYFGLQLMSMESQEITVGYVDILSKWRWWKWNSSKTQYYIYGFQVIRYPGKLVLKNNGTPLARYALAFGWFLVDDWSKMEDGSWCLPCPDQTYYHNTCISCATCNPCSNK